MALRTTKSNVYSIFFEAPSDVIVLVTHDRPTKDANSQY